VSRYLFVVPPLVGHVNPTVGVAAELAARGHEVAWTGLPELVRPLVGPHATVLPCGAPAGGLDRPTALRGPAALRFLWLDFLIPLAGAMLPGVLDSIEDFGPDVLVADQQAVAGGIAAERCALPWATSATTSAELFGQSAAMSGVDGWVRERLAPLAGAADGVDPRFSPYLVLVFSTELLVGPELAAVAVPGGGPVRFVGPSLAGRASSAVDGDFPWELLEPGRPGVLVSLGTANAGAGGRFLAACVEALGARPDLRGVVADPGAEVTGPVPGNVLVRPRVPQLALLPRLSTVICHGGHNTTCEALDAGLPLVLAPIRDDQPLVAEQVVAAGAGIRLRFGRATAAQVGAAVDTVLAEPAYAAAAGRVRESFRAAGGSAAAADHLEGLAPAHHATPAPVPVALERSPTWADPTRR
jgi:UDP:flavonoid glycosyltransferase YjiC (YdhE family)